MKENFNCILLIDDDSATNFIHKMLLNQTAAPKQIVAVENGSEALSFLQTEVNDSYPQPELILLDINMPVMNGWEFLENYQELSTSQQGGKIILMITSPLNEEERLKAEKISVINGFMKKPLTANLVKDLLQKHF